MRPHGLTRYKHGPDEHGTEGKGCRCTPCRTAVWAYDSRRSRLIAYGRWEYPLDAAGTRRRLQALIWNGWSAAALAARYGCTPRAVRKMLAYERVSAATAAKVRALCRELCGQPPPQRTPHERRAVTLARNLARKMGWAPMGAWDDDPGPHYIDDPAAVPVPGCWRGAQDRPPDGPPAVAAVIRQAREAAGLTRPRLALVLGVSASAVKMWEDGARTPGEENWEQLELTLGPLGVVRDRRAGAGDGGRRGDESDAA